ncbi:MerR family transcriptional regulator [Lacticaseibacillus nasuensis]|uniref:MerR family transcriptional regulator n=1 Tax=Lacticaseibacillus nasuensis TaxID=944671 RepID=UPI00224758D7|nr:MerR family transcriptional regulator [Lacticaseibacillus nasuensis]MCX2455311.1 MerR family transcriptional regulator [Lacticaseibacillus nasuensis]
MLKISEMAKLANTTRRTLIFYDEQGVFQPVKKSASGYRYYDYSQVYELLTILGLRDVGLSLAQIKAIQAGSQQSQPELQQALSKITGQLTQLQHIQAILAQRLAAQTAAAPPQPYQPGVAALPAATYWCSRKAVDCTEAEIATLFAEFYRELGAAALLDTETSGFITDLPVTNPGGYMAASFRILKATTQHADEPYIPQLERPAGRYVRVWVENTQAGIDRGLRALQAYCQAQALQPQPVLWQLNAGDALVTHGATKFGWLAYALA